MHLAFLGFGLIGGFDRARRAGQPGDGRLDDGRLVADRRRAAPARRPRGSSTRAATTPESALDGADLVVLAAPATACLELIDGLAGPWRDRAAPTDAVVTDVASTKAATRGPGRRGRPALRRRPPDGRPRDGRLSAPRPPTCSRDRPWVVVPGALPPPADIARVRGPRDVPARRRVDRDGRRRARPGGRRRSATCRSSPRPRSSRRWPASLPPTRPPIVADWPIAAGLAAGGWRDTTRSPAATRRWARRSWPPTRRRSPRGVRDLRAVLDAWLAELERAGGPDEAAVTRGSTAARAVLERDP